MIFFALCSSIYSYYIEDSRCVKLDLRTALFYFRDFIFLVMEFLQSEERFVSSFMKASREHYGRLLFPNNTATLSSKYVDASVTRTVHGLVDEVSKFFMYHFVCTSNIYVFVIC